MTALTSANTRVLIDLDGVVVDLMGAASARGLFDHYPCRWDFSGCCTWRTENDVFEQPELFLTAEPIEGAVEGVQVLMANGCDVRFVSTPWMSAPWSAMEKYMWVRRHFGDPTLLTLTCDKTLVPGAVLIDDRPGLVGPWYHIEYPQPWNSQRHPSWTTGLVDLVLNEVL